MPNVNIVCPACNHAATVEVELTHSNAVKKAARDFAATKPIVLVKIKCFGDHRYKSMLLVKGETHDIDRKVAEHLVTTYPKQFKIVKK